MHFSYTPFIHSPLINSYQSTNLINQVYLHTAPLCHIGGISSALAVLMAGGCHVIEPKFETESAFEAIRDHNVTSLITVPTMMADFISFHLYVVFY